MKKKLIIQPISALLLAMSPEAKAKAKADFEKYFPPGTPEIMCTSQVDGDGEQYLKPVNLDDFNEPDILPCKTCGNTTADTEFRDCIGCISYVECYGCRSTGPCSKNHGMDKKAAEIEAIVLWNESR